LGQGLQIGYYKKVELNFSIELRVEYLLEQVLFLQLLVRLPHKFLGLNSAGSIKI